MDKQLMREAVLARQSAYAPYSNFMVGSALLCEDGEIVRGCNVENSAHSPTNCAERTAFFCAVAMGKNKFTAIAVAGWPKDGPPGCAYPCGVCRQVMVEFCNPKTFRILVGTSGEDYTVYTLEDLLPHSFGLSNLPD